VPAPLQPTDADLTFAAALATAETHTITAIAQAIATLRTIPRLPSFAAEV
jgi:hypothetical protein